ncbi:MAG: asparagine synthetase B [Nitrososphaerales archaeon]|nr:asparagine synthetase B [Nitrososphaerales archaeon]
MLSDSINGIVALLGESNVIPNLTSALKSISHRARYGYRILTEEGSLDDVSALNRSKSNLAIGCCLSRPSNSHKIAVHGKVYHPEGFDLSKRLKEVFEDIEKAPKILLKLDADFAFVGIEDNSLIYGRDSLGIKPLYSSKESGILGIASEIKALKSIGFKNIERVRPGSIHKASMKGEESLVFDKIEVVSKLNVSMDEASDTVLKLLSESIKRRIKGLNRIAIGFSGGLDSSLLALITSKLAKVTLLSIYTKGSKDEDVTNSAKSLGLELEELQIDVKQVKDKISLIQNLIESDRIMDLAIGLGMNLSAEKCLQIGCDVLFLGQFADELFGGYVKYVRALRERGDEFVENMMLQDVIDAHKNNFERDEKASSSHTEIRLPYANTSLVDYALSLPLRLKITMDDQRKLVLKEAAIKAGLPRDIASKRKRAFQYSSGLQKLITNVKG